MKLTKQEVLNLNQALSSLGNLQGVKFAYAIARNIAKLKPEIESLQIAGKPSDAFTQYEKERIELAEKYAKKVNGRAQTQIVGNGQQEYVLEDRQVFDTEFAALKDKHKIAIDEREKQLKDIEALLKEDVDIDFYTIQLKDVPQTISTQQMVGIYQIVEEDLKN